MILYGWLINHLLHHPMEQEALYIISKDGVTKKTLSNDVMQQLLMALEKISKLHWLAKPDTYLSSENYSKDLIVDVG